MAQGIDFSNPSLRNIVKALGPAVQLRIGGTASHGLVFTNRPSPPGCGRSVCLSSCCGSAARGSGAPTPDGAGRGVGAVFLSTTCVDSIGDFLVATGAELLFNLAPTRLDPSSNSTHNPSAWNSSNSELLLAYIGRQSYARHFVALEVGHEQHTITTGRQLGEDLVREGALLKGHR